ncbi:hypothetical protein EV359DRAFT_66490, partial [Lentinula novae-zelandiae]
MATLAAMENGIKAYQETLDSRIVNYASYAKTTVLAYEILINLVWSANIRWSNVWELCYKTSTPQYVHFLSISYCDALYQLFWYTSFIPTRAAITASFALRVYAIMDGRLLFVVILSALGVAIVGLDVWQGVQSSCSQSSNKLRKQLRALGSTSQQRKHPEQALIFALGAFVAGECSPASILALATTIATFISLACFDVLTTILVTVRMIQTIQWGRKLKGLESSRIAAYILRSGVLYFGAVTVPQLIAIALYFQGSSTILNNFMLVLSSIMVSRFLLDLRVKSMPRASTLPL